MSSLFFVGARQPVAAAGTRRVAGASAPSGVEGDDRRTPRGLLAVSDLGPHVDVDELAPVLFPRCSLEVTMFVRTDGLPGPHMEWVTALLKEALSSGRRSIEADASAQDAWAEHVTGLAGPLEVHESCNSWYLGANVPRKARIYMPYAGGLDVHMQHCADVAANGYPGFSVA